MILRLPLRVRNRLAQTILAAFSDSVARCQLEALAAAPAPPAGWLAADEGHHAVVLGERARRAATALAGRPLGSRRPALEEALEVAATLFDAGLYFETHEVLEPLWQEARGDTREALQGLIQVAVGYQHRSNANLAGAGSLLEEGARRLERGRLAGIDLAGFAGAVRASLEVLLSAGDDAAPAPAFPRAGAKEHP